METYERILSFELPKGQSAFLWGARKTGKSHFLKKKFPKSIYYDLLKSDEYWRLFKSPELLRQEILALSEQERGENPIIIDEVQKIPQILNEVHWLIENTNAYFILCGSSARKLKNEGANLLGGRAWRFHFFPLVSKEIPEFNLLRALNQGLIPSHYNSAHWKKTIKAYILDYLTEEIKAEGLTRNLLAFANFLDLAAFSSGEIMNFSNIARDCGIDSKTIREYYQILVDTLLGYYLQPYHNRKKREHIVVETPKFYLFDIGVINGLSKRQIPELRGAAAGAALEHFIFMEIKAYLEFNELDDDIHYWRTKTGLEVDFILGNAQVGIEVKISSTIDKTDLHGLQAFYEYAECKRSIVVCMTEKPRKLILDNNLHVDILPITFFLEQLWSGKIINTATPHPTSLILP